MRACRLEPGTGRAPQRGFARRRHGGLSPAARGVFIGPRHGYYYNSAYAAGYDPLIDAEGRCPPRRFLAMPGNTFFQFFSAAALCRNLRKASGGMSRRGRLASESIDEH
ncbi:hypothetical protein Busp01_52640 [Trinickia caryophylli]|nr:hypothetical protein Busp01_52640 [Trinickia caryophylli]